MPVIVPALRDEERHLMQDANVILIKNSLMQKVANLFGQLGNSFVSISEPVLPSRLLAISPKVSKGEKYLGLPYVVLDYPRRFLKDDTCAIRTLFWWGNYFTITLHLQGQWLEYARQAVTLAVRNGSLNNWHLQLEGDPWQHQVAPPFTEVVNVDPGQIETAPFLKLTKKIPLSEWDNIDGILTEEFRLLIGLI